MAVDQTIIDNLVKQILASSDTSKWQGEGYGGAEANAKAMAKLMADAGMTDIKQFGKVDKYEPVDVIGKTYNGNRVYLTGADEYGNGGGSYYYSKPTGGTDSEGNPIYETVFVPKDAKLDNLYGFAQDSGEGVVSYSPIDPSKVVMRDGVPTTVTGQTFGNKETGEAINRGSGRWARQGGEDLFSGTGEGKGNTAFRAQFDAQGNPVFYTTAGSSSDVSPLMKTALLGAGLYFGLGGLESLFGGAAGGSAAGAAGLTATEAAGLGLTASEAAALGLSSAEYAAAAGSAGLLSGAASGSTVAGMGTGTGLTAGGSGLGLNAAGTAGLGAEGLGAGLTTGTGLTGTGVLTGSELGTGLLTGGGTTAGLTGTGILAGSELGTSLLGTTGTGALTGTGVLTGSALGTGLIGTGAGTAATVGGVTGLTNTANVGTGALNTGVTGVTGVTGGAGGTTGGTGGTIGGTGGTGTGLITGLTTAELSKLISGALSTTGGLLQQQTSKEAAEAAQKKIEEETAAAKAAAQFRPVGMTTRFGTSNFTYNPTTGQMESAGYTLSPEAKAQQDRLMALAEQGLTQAEQAQGLYAPLQTGAQSLFNLGNKYLAQTPEEVAQRYITQQMNLLQPGRELELANLQNKLQQQGRSGLAVAQGGSYGATTPELQALFNARAAQEAKLAADAELAGQQQVTFGAGLLTKGAGALGDYYGGQEKAYAPYTIASTKAQGLETLAERPLSLSTQIGQMATNAGVNSGNFGLKGAELSTRIATSPAATTNPYSTVLAGLSDPSSTISQGVADYIKKNWI